MSRTRRKKPQFLKSPTIGTDGPTWRDASDLEHVVRREIGAIHREEARAEDVVVRVRRGEKVEVPARWQGQTVGRQRKAQRRAAARNKARDRRRRMRRLAKLDAIE